MTGHAGGGPCGNDSLEAWQGLVADTLRRKLTLFQVGQQLEEIFRQSPTSLGRAANICWNFCAGPPTTTERQRDLLPLPLGISSVEDRFQQEAAVHQEGWPQLVTAWVRVLVVVLNFSFSLGRAHTRFMCPLGPVTLAQQGVLDRLGSAAARLSFDETAEMPACDWRRELKEKRIDYHGEESGAPMPLTLEQVVPTLPPRGIAGSIDAIEVATGEVRACLSDPGRCLKSQAELDEIPPKKRRARVHAAPIDWDAVGQYCFDLGIMDAIQRELIFTIAGHKVTGGGLAWASPRNQRSCYAVSLWRLPA